MGIWEIMNAEGVNSGFLWGCYASPWRCMRSSSKRCSWLTSRAPEEAHDSLRLPWLVAVPPDGWDLAMTKLGRIVGEKKGGGLGDCQKGIYVSFTVTLLTWKRVQSLSHERISSEDTRLLPLILYSAEGLWTCELCILGIRAGTKYLHSGLQLRGFAYFDVFKVAKGRTSDANLGFNEEHRVTDVGFVWLAPQCSEQPMRISYTRNPMGTYSRKVPEEHCLKTKKKKSLHCNWQR